jgi:predicted amidophosphoribosyltransferase
VYCRKCYAQLDRDPVTSRCPRCGRPFDPENPRTYLNRPFPNPVRIVLLIVVTSIICIAAVFVVSFFQLAGASGH